MSTRSGCGAGLLLAIAGALSCATSPAPPRQSPPPAGASEPLPPPSQKKGVVVPADVKLGGGPSDSTSNTGTAGPAVGPSIGTSSGPN